MEKHLELKDVKVDGTKIEGTVVLSGDVSQSVVSVTDGSILASSIGMAGGGAIGTIVSGINFTRTSVFEPKPIFCTKDGVLLQLWVDLFDSRDRQWKPIPDFAEASKTYSCDKVNG